MSFVSIKSPENLLPAAKRPITGRLDTVGEKDERGGYDVFGSLNPPPKKKLQGLLMELTLVNNCPVRGQSLELMTFWAKTVPSAVIGGSFNLKTINITAAEVVL